MDKTRASSSKRPHIKESHQEEEEDLLQTYKVKFPILTHEQGAKFTMSLGKSLVVSTFLTLF